MVAPCKGCQERIVGCHSNCEKYKQWQMWHAEMKTKAAAEQTPMLSEYSFSFPVGKKHRRRR